MLTQCAAYTFSGSVVKCNTCLLKLRACLDFEYRLRYTSSQVFNDSSGRSCLSLKLHLHGTRRASFGSPLLANVYLLNAVKDIILKAFNNMRFSLRGVSLNKTVESVSLLMVKARCWSVRVMTLGRPILDEQLDCLEKI